VDSLVHFRDLDGTRAVVGRSRNVDAASKGGRTMRRLWSGLRAPAALAACAALVIAGTLLSPASGQGMLTVRVDSIKPGGVIPPVYAYCVPAQHGHTAPGPNRSPAVSWSKGPARTASYAIITVDPDVPTVFDDADKEGKTIPASMKRRDFYHWVLVDIPAATTSLPAAADSSEPSPKQPGRTKHGLRGINDYSGGGKIYGGYDGPCPPWNDEIVHHYHFRVYALDVARLGVSGNFTGPDALKAMQGHILARGEVVGLYTQNPDVAKTLK
jgi:Raf kinase inhibitor-like YbhB/YbcL family protein